MACCPAHTDKNPSLSIKETQDGDVLLHCFSGCGVDDVLAALGLEMSDLFSKPVAHSCASSPHTFTAEDVLVALVYDLNDLCADNPDPHTARAHFLEALDFIKGLQ